MKRVIRLSLVLLLIVVLFALPAGVLANKRIYKAAISSANEPVQATARGASTIATNIDGSLRFVVNVRNLSGVPAGVHLHGPAAAGETAGVLITLCGAGPTPAVIATCPALSPEGIFYIEGMITPTVLQQSGLTGRALFQYLDAEQVYVNVHTALFPDGEARGQYIKP
jgi:hypothetical protein